MSKTSSQRSFFWSGLVALGAVLLVWLILPRTAPEPPLRKYALVPPFSLTERNGKTITNHDFEGKIYVADFIFTTCPGPCPIISANMAKLQQNLAGDSHVQLVSFTVDPEDDTPAVLSAYADHLGADPRRWWFLTGPKAQVYDLIQNGFYQTIQDNHGKQLEPGQYLVTHSTYMVLVDAQGFMRGFYGGLDAEDQANLVKAIRQLEKE